MKKANQKRKLVLTPDFVNYRTLFPAYLYLFWIISGLPLALIGNASGQTFALERISIRGVFDKEVRRKPLAFAADA
jgi:hypothetical protein